MSESAQYNLTMEDRGDYLYALAGGDVLTPEISRMYWDEIAAECEKLGRTKIMIEKDFARSVSAAEMLSMGVYLGHLLPDRQIAFLDRFETENEDVNELGKKIARNQGVKMQVFKNRDDAERWLRH